MLIFGIIALLLLLTWTFFFTPFRIDYTNGGDSNNAAANATAQIAIQAQTVPTVINGIATLTGIVVGFSGAILGIMLKDFIQGRKAKEIMMGFFFLPFLFPMILLFFAYYNLAVGGRIFLAISWGYALDAFIIAIFQLLFIFLFYAYVTENPKPEKSSDSVTPSPPQPPMVQTTPQTPTNIQPTFNTEFEFKKIETVKESFQNYFKIGSTILTGGLTALVVLILTLYFSHSLDWFTAIMEGVLVGVVMCLAFWVNNRRYMTFLRHYDIWLKKIESKTQLPTIVEMTKEATKKIAD